MARVRYRARTKKASQASGSGEHNEPTEEQDIPESPIETGEQEEQREEEDDSDEEEDNAEEEEDDEEDAEEESKGEGNTQWEEDRNEVFFTPSVMHYVMLVCL